jgi:hypothetical protein
MTASTWAAGVSICKTTIVSGVIARPASAPASSAALAPDATAIWLRPWPSTHTAASPVAPGTVFRPPTSIPRSARAVRAVAPKSSAPTQPMKRVPAPSRAAAIAWFAPLPPTACVTAGVSTVSPTAGRCGRRKVKSTLIEPNTVIIARSRLPRRARPASTTYRRARAGSMQVAIARRRATNPCWHRSYRQGKLPTSGDI